MKTNGVPAIVMLSAGLIDCVIALRAHLSLFAFTKQLLLVLLLFYVIGCVVQYVLDRNFSGMADEKTEPQESGQETEEQAKEAEEQAADEPEQEAPENQKEAG